MGRKQSLGGAVVVAAFLLAASTVGCGAARADDQPVSTSEGTLAFRLLTIFYDPPGGKSVQRYGDSSVASRKATWQTISASGSTTAVQVSAAQAPMMVDGLTSSTVINLAAHSDVPSGLFDQFFLALGIPATLDVFSQDRAQQLNLDYLHSTTVILSGQQLLALAESSPTAQTALSSGTAPLNQAQVDAVNQFITPQSARDLLLLDANFFAPSPDGPLVVRNASQLAQWVEADGDRYQPLAVESGVTGPFGSSLGNTLSVAAATQPGDPQSSTAATQPLGDSTGPSAADAPFQVPVTISVSGLDTRFVEDYPKIVMPRTSSGSQNSVTLQMSTPCLNGFVDLYYDAAFGTAFYVAHDIQFVSAPPGNPAWYSQCTGDVSSLDGTACEADTDCASRSCTKQICAPPACSPNCDAGAACGMGGPFGDCSGNNCNDGLCAD